VLVRLDPKSYKGAWVNKEPSNSRSVDLVGKKFVDFASVPWDQIAPGAPLADGLAFFDDHMDHLTRLQEARVAGFGHALVDDNFVPGFGDLFSIKNACDGGPGDDGAGASGGAVRRAFTPKNRDPRRCTKFHKKCVSLTNGAAVAARKELLEMIEAVWEAPPLTPIESINQYSQLQRIGKWAEGRAPKTEQDLQMLSQITKEPVFSSIVEAAGSLRQTPAQLRMSRGWYMHMAYAKLRKLTEKRT
jgi:hypothetical protein